MPTQSFVARVEKHLVFLCTGCTVPEVCGVLQVCIPKLQAQGPGSTGIEFNHFPQIFPQEALVRISIQHINSTKH